jgi:hypothetical protein
VVKGDKERSVVSEEKGSAFPISYTLPLYKRNRWICKCSRNINRSTYISSEENKPGSRDAIASNRDAELRFVFSPFSLWEERALFGYWLCHSDARQVSDLQRAS